MKTVLVVAVHPDDETLGCGGTLLKHKAAGDAVHWLVMTRATAEAGFAEEDIQRREEVVTAVARAYAFDSVVRMPFSTTCLDRYPRSELVTRISEAVHALRPDTMYIPFHADVHSDHRVTFDAVIGCTKTFRYPFVRSVLMMETLSETEFAPALAHSALIPNVFVDISEQLERKLEIMSLYSSELGRHPFPRSLERLRAQALMRGATASVSAAEAFVLLKEIR